jgi:hypothetical protein
VKEIAWKKKGTWRLGLSQEQVSQKQRDKLTTPTKLAREPTFQDQKTKVIPRVEPKKYPPKAQTTLYPQQSMLGSNKFYLCKAICLALDKFQITLM